MNPRVTATQILSAVSHDGVNLESAFEKFLSDAAIRDQPFIKALCFGTLREYPRLQFVLDRLLSSPLKPKEYQLHNLILAGLYECQHMQTPEHACVSETVQAAVSLKKTWAKGLINAVLRNALRKQPELQTAIQNNEIARLAHPRWLIEMLKQDWPDDYEKILQANNQQGPLSLRINQQKLSRDAYLAELASQNISAEIISHTTHGIEIVQARDVTTLPGYAEGKFSVQDAAAQQAAKLLAPQNHQYVLDACAAPGGKTTHLLEIAPDIELLSLDISKKRLEKIQENLQRLGLKGRVVPGNAADPQSWWDGDQFNCILLDAPCSATGVIRRHPDIKLLRKAADIVQLVKTQQEILFALWPLLKPGGMLLYATCSVLREENDKQIQRLIDKHSDARPVPIQAEWGRPLTYGRQILPGDANMDGFYYALITRSG